MEDSRGIVVAKASQLAVRRELTAVDFRDPEEKIALEALLVAAARPFPEMGEASAMSEYVEEMKVHVVLGALDKPSARLQTMLPEITDKRRARQFNEFGQTMQTRVEPVLRQLDEAVAQVASADLTASIEGAAATARAATYLGSLEMLTLSMLEDVDLDYTKLANAIFVTSSAAVAEFRKAAAALGREQTKSSGASGSARGKSPGRAPRRRQPAQQAEEEKEGGRPLDGVIGALERVGTVIDNAQRSSVVENAQAAVATVREWVNVAAQAQLGQRTESILYVLRTYMLITVVLAVAEGLAEGALYSILNWGDAMVYTDEGQVGTIAYISPLPFFIKDGERPMRSASIGPRRALTQLVAVVSTKALYKGWAWLFVVPAIATYLYLWWASVKRTTRRAVQKAIEESRAPAQAVAVPPQRQVLEEEVDAPPARVPRRARAQSPGRRRRLR